MNVYTLADFSLELNWHCTTSALTQQGNYRILVKDITLST